MIRSVERRPRGFSSDLLLALFMSTLYSCPQIWIACHVLHCVERVFEKLVVQASGSSTLHTGAVLFASTLLTYVYTIKYYTRSRSPTRATLLKDTYGDSAYVLILTLHHLLCLAVMFTSISRMRNRKHVVVGHFSFAFCRFANKYIVYSLLVDFTCKEYYFFARCSETSTNLIFKHLKSSTSGSTTTTWQMFLWCAEA